MTDPLRSPTGRFNRPVTLAAFTVTGEDDRGTPLGTWADLATVWAHWQPLSGRWAETARQLVPTATVRALIQYRSDVALGQRVTLSGALYRIAHIIDLPPGNHTLELLLTEEP